MREYIRRLLAGYDVVAVEDGSAALQSARARRPDLVLTEVMMPGVNGLELMHELISADIFYGLIREFGLVSRSDPK